MNLLTDKLPTSLLIDGYEYPVNSDFRTMIQFEVMMFDEDLSDKERITQALELFYRECPHDIAQAIDRLLWFYRCGKDEESNAKTSGGGSGERIYSFTHDDAYIFSAFLNQYAINLQEIEYLHWWQFRAMFKSLNDSQEFVKIMRFRAMDLSKITDKEQKAYYKKMKEIYKIQNSHQERDKKELDELTNALLNGGDVSNLL